MTTRHNDWAAEAQPKYSTLTNGAQLVEIEISNCRKLCVAVFIRAGASHDSVSGLAHFVEHVLFRGSRTYPDTALFMREFEKRIGSVPQAVTKMETTEFGCITLPHYGADAVNMIGELILKPVFNDIDRERSIIIEEIAADYNHQGQLIDLPTLMGEMLWQGSPLSNSIGGTEASLQAIGKPELQNYHSQYYCASNMLWAVAGSYDSTAIKHQIEALQPAGTINQPPARPSSIGKQRIKFVNDTDSLTNIQLSFPITKNHSSAELYFLAFLLDSGPNSILNRRLREEQALTYHVGCEYVEYAHVSQLDIITSSKPENFLQLLESLLQCLNQIKGGQLDADELEHFQRNYQLNMCLMADEPEALIGHYANPYRPVNSLTAWRNEICSLSVSSIQRLSNEIFNQHNLYAVICGNIPDREAITKLLKAY